MICALYISETLLLVCNSIWSASRKSFCMSRWKNWWPVS